MQMYDLVVVGELNADLILSGEVAPAFGQVERLADDATLTMGSSSAIFACGAARLGLRVAFAGLVGDDEFGRFMLRALAGRGVDTAAVAVDPAVKTGLSVILSRGRDRAILTYPGSIAALRLAQIEPGLRALVGRARHLHLGGYYLLDGLRPDVPALLAAARAAGLTTSLDPNYDPAGRWGGLDDLLPHLDILLPNEAELLALSGAATAEAGAALLAPRVPALAVKLGARGAAAWRGGERAAAAPPPVAAVESTGAGDSFDAGFVYGHLAGWGLGPTLRLACACGALSTRAAGGVAAQPTLDEALALV